MKITASVTKKNHKNMGTNKIYVPVHKTNYEFISGHMTFL